MEKNINAHAKDLAMAFLVCVCVKKIYPFPGIHT